MFLDYGCKDTDIFCFCKLFTAFFRKKSFDKPVVEQLPTQRETHIPLILR